MLLGQCKLACYIIASRMVAFPQFYPRRFKIPLDQIQLCAHSTCILGVKLLGCFYHLVVVVDFFFIRKKKDKFF